MRDSFGGSDAYFYGDDGSTRQGSRFSPSAGMDDGAGAYPVRAAISVNNGRNASQALDEVRLAHRLSIPVETVRLNAETARREEQARSLERTPELAEFASKSPEYAALALENTPEWEHFMGVARERDAQGTPWTRAKEAASEAWDQGERQYQTANYGNAWGDAAAGSFEESTAGHSLDALKIADKRAPVTDSFLKSIGFDEFLNET